VVVCRRKRVWPTRAADLAAHPTVKPVALVADAIRDVFKRGAIVLDSFAGAGSTILAAERTGRRAAAIEIDPLYVDTATPRSAGDEDQDGEACDHALRGIDTSLLSPWSDERVRPSVAATHVRNARSASVKSK
jgi:hypothetical protein